MRKPKQHTHDKKVSSGKRIITTDDVTIFETVDLTPLEAEELEELLSDAGKLMPRLSLGLPEETKPQSTLSSEQLKRRRMRLLNVELAKHRSSRMARKPRNPVHVGGYEFASQFVSWYDNLLKDKNYSQDELGQRTLLEEASKQRLEAAENTLVDQFKAVQVALNLTDEEIRESRNRVKDRLSEEKNQAPELYKEQSVNLPTKAPELYKERADRKEKSDAFTRRVYKLWLGKGLLRPHIKKLDKPLYQALYKNGFPDDFDTLLPTAQGKGGGNRGIRPQLSDTEFAERTRANTRLRVRKYRERKMQ